MIKKFEIKSNERNELIEITSEVKKIIKEAKIKSGFCIIYVPHTTAGLIINENADPDVKIDLLNSLEKLVPSIKFLHIEGNSDSHLKSLICGKDKTIIIENNELVLGVWDGLFFAEFDGPRTRKVVVKLISD